MGRGRVLECGRPYVFGVVSLLLLGTSPWTGFSATVDPAWLDRAFAQLQTYDWGQPANALLALDEAIAATHQDPASRLALEQRLVAMLQTNAPVAAKQLVCRKLALVGSRVAVPALAPLLTQDDLSHMARFALERIPDPTATAALRDALSKTRGQVKTGVINSLGVLADPKAASALVELLAEADPAIAGAAAAALGKIGTWDAARALGRFRATAPRTLQPQVNEACLEAAENLVRRDQREEAARIFRQLYEDPTDAALRLAAFRGLLLTEPEPRPAISLVARALMSDDEPLRSLAGRILAEPPGERVLDPFLRLLPSLPPAGQVALLGAIRAKPHASARPAVLGACDSREPSVRLAALRALGVVGTSQDVPRLAPLSTTGENPERDAARLALATLPGREPTRVIADLLGTAAPSLRVELLRVLMARGATESTPHIVAQMNDADPAVRQAALEAVGILGDEQQASRVIALFKAAPDDAARGQAEKALSALVARTGEKCREALLEGLTGTKPATRLFLLEQLGSLGGSRALAAVRAAVASEDAGLREGAFRVLAAWPDAEAAPDLLQVARRPADATRRALAFRGYVRLCREAPMASSERLTHLTDAAKLATSTEEKVLVVSALAEVPEPGSLPLLAAYLDDGAVADAASVAAVKAASALDARHKAAVASLLEHVLRVCQNAAVRNQARAVLTKLGVPSQ